MVSRPRQNTRRLENRGRRVSAWRLAASRGRHDLARCPAVAAMVDRRPRFFRWEVPATRTSRASAGPGPSPGVTALVVAGLDLSSGLTRAPPRAQGDNAAVRAAHQLPR